MTAAPQSIATAHSWRSTPVSPLLAFETAAILVFILIVIGVAAVRARAAMERARMSSAAAEIRILDPIVGAYALDHSGYTGMTSAALKNDYGLRLDTGIVRTLKITDAGSSGYCVQIHDGAWYAAQQGPGAEIVASRSPVC